MRARAETPPFTYGTPLLCALCGSPRCSPSLPIDTVSDCTHLRYILPIVQAFSGLMHCIQTAPAENMRGDARAIDARARTTAHERGRTFFSSHTATLLRLQPLNGKGAGEWSHVNAHAAWSPGTEQRNHRMHDDRIGICIALWYVRPICDQRLRFTHSLHIAQASQGCVSTLRREACRQRCVITFFADRHEPLTFTFTCR